MLVLGSYLDSFAPYTTFTSPTYLAKVSAILLNESNSVVSAKFFNASTKLPSRNERNTLGWEDRYSDATSGDAYISLKPESIMSSIPSTPMYSSKAFFANFLASLRIFSVTRPLRFLPRSSSMSDRASCSALSVVNSSSFNCALPAFFSICCFSAFF